MERVSQAWKDAHKDELLPESYVEITYKVSESGVNDSYIVSDNGHMPWSDTSHLDNADMLTKYATLEQNIWALDGSFVIPNAPYSDGKFVSSGLSGEDGVFELHPEIILSWDHVNRGIIPGITVQWSKTYDEYPLDYSVKVYNGETLVHSADVKNNDSAFNVFYVDIQDYDRLVIEIERWNLPYHRARMEKVYVGIIETYTKNELMSYKHEDNVDILSGELPKDSITFSLDNTDSQWNPLNPTGANKYLMERQTLRVRYGMEVDGVIEWIDAGVFFLSEWSTPSNGIEATFTARDMLEFFSEPYTGVRSGTLYDIAIAAVTQIDLPDDATYRFDVSLLSINVDFSNKEGEEDEYSCAEILQMVANAGKCIIYQDRSGCLRIEPASQVLSDYVISQFVSYSHPEFTLSKELKAVNVNDGMAVVSNSAQGEIQTLDNPLVTEPLQAQELGEWIKDILKGRKTVIGDFRADPRLSAGDIVTVENKFSEKGNKVFITSIQYSFGGAFKGNYEGRLLDG